MTRHARETILLAVATALGEAALQALTIADWSNVAAHALLFAFLIGPLLFLALLAWRRSEHAQRSRYLFIVTVVIAVGGLGVLGFNLYRFRTDANVRKEPNMLGLIVPLVQWGTIMAIWLWLMIQESREKRWAGKAAQAPASASHQNMTNPSQSS